MMNELIDYLRDLKPMSAELHGALQQKVKSAAYRARTILPRIRQDSRLSVVAKGMLRGFHRTEAGESTAVFFRENQALLQSLPMENVPLNYLVLQAIEDCRIEYLDAADVHDLKERFGFGYYIQAVSTIYWQQIQWQAVLRGVKPGLRRYQHLMEQDPELMGRVPLKYVASFLGVARETASRFRSKKIR